MIYHLWSKTFTGYRFIDVWGVSPEDLKAVPGIELVIGPGCNRYLSAMFKVGNQNSIVEHLVSRGVVEYHPVSKPSQAAIQGGVK